MATLSETPLESRAACSLLLLLLLLLALLLLSVYLFAGCRLQLSCTFFLTLLPVPAAAFSYLSHSLAFKLCLLFCAFASLCLAHTHCLRAGLKKSKKSTNSRTVAAAFFYAFNERLYCTWGHMAKTTARASGLESQ